jgi:hypothetical protein
MEQKSDEKKLNKVLELVLKRNKQRRVDKRNTT